MYQSTLGSNPNLYLGCQVIKGKEYLVLTWGMLVMSITAVILTVECGMVFVSLFCLFIMFSV